MFWSSLRPVQIGPASAVRTTLQTVGGYSIALPMLENGNPPKTILLFSCRRLGGFEEQATVSPEVGTAKHLWESAFLLPIRGGPLFLNVHGCSHISVDRVNSTGFFYLFVIPLESE